MGKGDARSGLRLQTRIRVFLTFGHEGVRAITGETDNEIFLDLKLHDIPHTVSGAARAISSLRPKYLTVHASGGSAMIAAAVEAVPPHLSLVSRF